MKEKRLIPIRLSHLLRHCSVGSIVRGPDYLLVVSDTRRWTDPTGKPVGRVISYVEQVKSAMEIDCELREPPVALETSKGVQGYVVPSDIFPSWMRCNSQRCGALHYKPWRGDGSLSQICRICNKGKLEQVPWVLVHEDGHLADVPWHFLTHKNASSPAQKNCKRTWDHPYLKLQKLESGKMELRCNVCNTSNLFDTRDKIPFNDNRQPWLRQSPEPSEKFAEILEVNDARLHMALTQNALVIPPESRIQRGTVVDRLYAASDKLDRVYQAKSPFQKKQALMQLARELQCGVNELQEAINEIELGYPLYGKEITAGLLLESEYEALTDLIPDLSDDEDFVPRHLTKQWRVMSESLEADSKMARIAALVESVVSVERLKEIMVLKGFQRLSREGKIVPPDIEGGSTWLPAIELYGEGLFVTFNQSILKHWESQETAIIRASELAKRYVASGYGVHSELVVSPRFLLLHTLAHMLIKELENQAGYPAASLKERIYCSYSSKAPMAGILIYIAVPDVVGSLGGLAEQANPKRLLALLSRVFNHAEWCSFDPVCSEHEGQGPGLLNKAACHACALIPEPSCTYGNILLDRLFVRGDTAKVLRSVLEFVKATSDG